MSDAIRPYQPSDLARLREICVRTGAAGGDATGRWSTDALLPDLFLEPYVTAHPEWAWVIDEGEGAIGYVIATPDTRRFVRWWAARWSPWFVGSYPPAQPPFSAEDELVDRGARPEVMLIPEVDEYPAHLHIDLLPEAQGRGWGRELIETHLVGALAAAGIPGVHLTLDGTNVRAAGFYRSLGFVELPSSTPEGPTLGRWISSRR